MKHPTADTLVAMQSQKRFMLFLSLLLFLVALFALVSRWPVAYALIAFSCVFHLLSSLAYKTRYKAAFIQVLLEQAASDMEAVAYAASETADGLLAARGLTPGVPFVAGAKQHHVLRGSANGVRFSLSEAVFLRKREGRAMGAVGGTLVLADGVLPQSERWMLALGEPFAKVCSADEYVKAGYVLTPLADAPQEEKANASPALWLYQGKDAEYARACAAALRRADLSAPVALAACEGSLSLFLLGAYYAPNQVDSAKPFHPGMLEGVRLPAFELMQKLINDAVRQV